MFLILGIFASAWNNVYNTVFGSLDKSTRNTVGLWVMVFAILMFVSSMKGSKKSQVINSWFLFWISIIAAIISILYLVY